MDANNTHIRSFSPTRLLSHLFPIKAEEWPAALLFFSMQLAFAFGAAIARSVGFTLMVGNLGKDFLPFAFIGIDVTMIFASLLYVRVAKAQTGIRIIYALMSIMVIFSVTSWLLLRLQLDWSYGLFFIGFFTLHILSTIHLSNFIAAHYTPVQSKRILAFVYAGIPVGGALGGLSLIGLLTFLPPETLTLVLSVTALATAFIAAKVAGVATEISTSRIQANITKKKTTVFKAFQQTFAFIIQTPLLRYMALSTFLFVLATRLLEFQYQGIIYPEAYPDLSERAIFFGQYEIVANIAWLIFQLFIASRIFLTFGIGGSNLVHPTLVVIASGGLLFSFSFIPAIMAQFINQELRAAIRGSAHNLLLNALPRSQWPSVQAFLNGAVFPLATVIASSLLLWMQDVFSIETLTLSLPLLSLILGMTGIVIAIRQWQCYNKGIIELLGQSVKRGNNSKGFKGLDKELRHYLQYDNLHEVNIALEMVQHLKDPTFIPLVGKRLLQSRSLEIKRECAKTLAALPKADASLIYLLRSLKVETDPQTLAILLRELSHFSGETVIHSAEYFLKHPYPEVFAAACFCLLQQNARIDKEKMRAKLLIRLKLQNPQQRLHSIDILGQLSDQQLSVHIEPFLHSINPTLNIAAFRSWVILNKDILENFKEELLQTLVENNTKAYREKQIIALTALMSCTAPNNWQAVIALLNTTDQRLLTASQALLKQHLHSSQTSLLNAFKDKQQALNIRQQCLQILWYSLSKKAKIELIQVAKKALIAHLETRLHAFYLQQQYHPQTIDSQQLLLKLFAEQVNDQLAICLDVMAMASAKDLDFSRKLLNGLQSKHKGQQGNALEAISNCREKVLSKLLLQVFDHPLDSLESVKQVLQLYFPKQAKNTENNSLQAISPKGEFAQSVWQYWLALQTKN